MVCYQACLMLVKSEYRSIDQMRYEVFKDAEVMNSLDYMTQEHMQDVFTKATMVSDDEKDSFNDRLGPEFISCDAEECSLTLLFHTEPWMCNKNGNMHGGMIASVCDLTMGLLSRYYKRTHSCSTIHLGIEYARGVSPEGNVIVKAVMEKAGRNVFFTSAKVYRSTDDCLAALATAEFM